MPRVAVEVPCGWGDITDTVEADNPPYTLAHRDGVGALQFSVAGVGRPQLRVRHLHLRGRGRGAGAGGV
jgi:hypothetical protein